MTRQVATDRERRWAEFMDAHRARGLPVTMQRRAVFGCVMDRDDHPSADEIYESVRQQFPGISRMTVYRILGNFVALGLLHKTCHPGSVARFDPKTRRHHHLVCVACGAITDVELEGVGKLNLPAAARLGFEIEDYQIHFRGRCSACRQAKKRARDQKDHKPRT